MLSEFLPDNWSSIDLLFAATTSIVFVWLVLSVFIYWRRSATNLTPVDVPSANPAAQPDFLSVNHSERKAALKRGDQYERHLTQRERDPDGTAMISMLRSVCGYAAVMLSVASLLTVIGGSVWPDSAVGKVLTEFSSEGRLLEVIQAHPIAISISMLAVCFSVWRLVAGREIQAA